MPEVEPELEHFKHWDWTQVKRRFKYGEDEIVRGRITASHELERIG